MSINDSIETKKGLMQARLDAKRAADKARQGWQRDYEGVLAKPQAQPEQPAPMQAPEPAPEAPQGY